jgi:hypothetical protein
MVRGFRFLIPGFKLRAMTDHSAYYDRLQRYIVGIYPDDWWVACYRGIPFFGGTAEEASRRLRQAMRLDGTPEEFAPRPTRIRIPQGRF